MRLRKRVEPLAAEAGSEHRHSLRCQRRRLDRRAPSTILKEHWGRLDFLVHAIAFSDKDQLTGRYIDTTGGNFTRTLYISCYSLTAVAQRAEPLMAAAARSSPSPITGPRNGCPITT